MDIFDLYSMYALYLGAKVVNWAFKKCEKYLISKSWKKGFLCNILTFERFNLSGWVDFFAHLSINNLQVFLWSTYTAHCLGMIYYVNFLGHSMDNGFIFKKIKQKLKYKREKKILGER